MILLAFVSLPALTNWLISLIIFGLIVLAWRLRHVRCSVVLVLLVLLGFLYAYSQAQQQLAQQLPKELEGQAIMVSGIITSIPEINHDKIRFALKPDATGVSEQLATLHGTIRVSWHRSLPETLNAGERWQLLVSCKRPNGLMNPGGFDYEKWLFAQGTSAVCYVRNSELNKRLSAQLTLDRVRQQVRDKVYQLLPETDERALITALSVAWRGDLSDVQWEVLRETGTGHLVAISGLHIGLVAGFGFLPVMVLWWLFPSLYLRLPLGVTGAIVGVVFAVGYALLAGFTVPTQRALLMVLVIMLGLVFRRSIPFTTTLGSALFAVLLIDPLAGLSAGFWLSFSAVFIIYLVNARGLFRQRFSWLTVQLLLSLGLMPLTASLFGSVSLISPLANLVAIPYVTLLVVPLVLLGVLSLLVSDGLAMWLWQWATWLLDGLFWLLGKMAEPDWAMWYLPAIPWQWVLVVLLGFALLLLPRGMPGRWLGAVLMLPLFFWQPDKPDQGAFELTLLDVGQGTASAVRTRHHILLFDAGPKASENFDTGKLVVLPWLRAQGLRQLDTLLISHADQDHAGGAQAVIAGMPVKRLIAGEPDKLPGMAVEPCQAGMYWEWDGVRFEILHFNDDYQGEKRNNRSCVVRVSNGYHSVLLTADIERSAEYWLVKQQGKALQSEVLVVPHHGSKSSSSPPFLKRVEPELAIVTAGYRNRFHHPHTSVVKRYQDWGIPLLNTAQSGAITVSFPVDETPLHIDEYRKQTAKFWNR